MSPGSSSPPSATVTWSLDICISSSTTYLGLNPMARGSELYSASISSRTSPRSGLALVMVTPSRVAANFTPRDQLSASQRIDEPHAIDRDDLLVLLRDHLLVGRELRVDQLDGDRQIVLHQEQVRRLDRDLARWSLLEHLLDLEQSLLGDDHAGRQLGPVGDRALDLAQAVTVGRHHAALGAIALEEPDRIDQLARRSNRRPVPEMSSMASH